MDIRAYLQRIQYQGPLEPTLRTLRSIHQAHLLTVPFENLSIHSGQPIILDEEALYAKIVLRHRGGFCYELNGLFAWLLRQLGFQVTLLSAGVYDSAGGFSPEFDHLMLLVHQLDGADWLADVGFGDSFWLPLRFEAEVEQDGGDGRLYRLRQPDPEPPIGPTPAYWIVERFSDAQWEPQNRFTLQPHALLDFTERCLYQQTSPESHFTQKRICSLATLTGRVTLSDLLLITTTHGERQEQLLNNQEEYTATLARYFGVAL